MLTDLVGCLDGGEDRRSAILEQWTAWSIMLERPTTLCKYPSGESIHWKKLAVFFFWGGMWRNDKVNLAPYWYIRETSSLNLTRCWSHRKQLYTRFTRFCPWKNCNAIYKSITQGPFFSFSSPSHPTNPPLSRQPWMEIWRIFSFTSSRMAPLTRWIPRTERNLQSHMVWKTLPKTSPFVMVFSWKMGPLNERNLILEIHPIFPRKTEQPWLWEEGSEGYVSFHLKSFLLWCISMRFVWKLQGRSALHNACAAGQTEAGKNFSTEEIPVIFGRGWLCWLWCQCDSVTFSRGVAENGWQGIAMTNLWSHCTGFRRIQSIQGFNCTWCWRIPFVSVQEYSLITGIHIM